MKILFLTHDYPFPVRTGGHVYTGNVARELANSGASVKAMAFQPGLERPNHLVAEKINWICFPLKKSGVISQLCSVYPALSVKNTTKEYFDELQKCLATDCPDVVIIDYIAIGWCLDVITSHQAKAGAQRPLTVYLSHNVEADLRRQIASNYPGNFFVRKLAAYDANRACQLESRLVKETGLTTSETEEDAARFRELYGEHRNLIVQPGYDGEYVTSTTLTSDVPRQVAVFGGRLSKMKQLVLDSFLEEASAGLFEKGIVSNVIGPISPDYKAKCEAAYPKVRFHGFQEDVKPLLAQMRLGVVADHVGGGFKHRILTYVFHRIPLVAIPETMAGLPLEPDRDYISVRSYRDLQEVCNRHINDLELLNRIQNSAYDRCLPVFSWNRTGRDFVAALAQLLNGGVSSLS